MNNAVQALRESYQVLVEICKQVAILPKNLKYSLGEKMENFAFDFVAEVCLATKAFGFAEKISHLQNAKKTLLLCEIAIKTCCDVGKLAHQIYKPLLEKINELSNQISKRENFCKTKLKEQEDLLAMVQTHG